MPSISLQHTVNGSLADATEVLLSDETGTYGIRRSTDGVAVVSPFTVVTSDPTGVYTYDVSALSGGSYEAVWSVEYPAGIVNYRPQTFSVDSAAPFAGVRLMDVEQALSERLGPYFVLGSSANSTTGLVQSLELISSIESGEFSDLYVLRRGRMTDGSAVVGFTSNDRVRQVAETNLANGQLVVDRAWATAPVEDEEFELHALHPTRELRRAVLQGLKRCYFEDRNSLTWSAATYEGNLTASFPWLTNVRRVRRVEAAIAGDTSVALPSPLAWFRPYTRGGNVWLQASAYTPYGVEVTALRSAYSYVNAATTVVGPNDDDDELAIDLEYAVAAAHMEAWRLFPARLLPAAQVGLQPARQDVAREFTKISLERNPRAPRSNAVFDDPPWPVGNILQVGA